jgi:hypothetical protein
MRRVYIYAIIAVVASIAVIPILNNTQSYESISNKADTSDNILALIRPSFGQSSGVNFLEDEAGIAAYVKFDSSINLDDARDAFSSIESETDEYIIGIIALANYGDGEYPHAFVHKDGWAVTYYPDTDPVVKIVDWNNWKGPSTNKLLIGMNVVFNAIKVVNAGPISYYHFQYPDANTVLIAVDDDDDNGNGIDFTIQYSSSLKVYERSFGSKNNVYGFLTFGNLLPDTVNEINLVCCISDLYINGNLISDDVRSSVRSSVVGIGLVYKE